MNSYPLVCPFISENKINKPLVAVFLLINGIVLFNAIFHPPFMQLTVLVSFVVINLNFETKAFFQIRTPKIKRLKKSSVNCLSMLLVYQKTFYKSRKYLLKGGNFSIRKEAVVFARLKEVSFSAKGPIIPLLFWC